MQPSLKSLPRTHHVYRNTVCRRVSGFSAAALLAAALLLVASLLPAMVQADGGFELPFSTMTSSGRGGAGAVTDIDSATAMAKNPATLASPKGGDGDTSGQSKFSLGSHLPFFHIGLSSTGERTTTGEAIDGGSSSDQSGIQTPLPDVGYSRQVDSNVRFGVAVTAPFGTNIRYDRGWNGRYHAIDTVFKGPAINAGFGFSVSERWTLGVSSGLQILTAELSQDVDLGAAVQRRINDEAGRDIVTDSCNATGSEQLPGKYDFYNKLDMNDIAVTGNIGALWMSDDRRSRFGISYRMGIDMLLRGNATRSRDDWDDSDFRNDGCFTATRVALAAQGRSFEEEVVGPALAAAADSSVKSRFHLPSSLELGAQFPVTDSVTAFLRGNWTHWSSQRNIRFNYGNSAPTTVQKQDLQNVVSGNFGLDWQLNQRLTLRGGIGYNGSTVNGDNRTARGADGERYTSSIGATYKRKRCSIDAALGYTRIDSGSFVDENRTTNDGNELSGTFHTSELYFFGTTMRVGKFGDFFSCLTL